MNSDYERMSFWTEEIPKKSEKVKENKEKEPKVLDREKNKNEEAKSA